MGRHMSARTAPVTEPPSYCDFFHTIQQDAINTAIADISDFQHTNMPANTAIADFADMSNIWATMGRHMSAGAAPGAKPPYYCQFFNPTHQDARNTAIAGHSRFPTHQHAGQHRYCRRSQHFRLIGNHVPAYVGRGRSWCRTTLLLLLFLQYNSQRNKKHSYWRHFRFPVHQHAGKHRYCLFCRHFRHLGNHGPAYVGKGRS